MRGVRKEFERKASRIIFAWELRYDHYEHFHFVFLDFPLFTSLILSMVWWVLLLYSVLYLVSLFSLSNDWDMVFFLWAWCLIKYTKAYCSSHQLVFHSSPMRRLFWLMISWVLHSCSVLAISFPILLCSHVFSRENALDCASSFENTLAAPNLEDDCHSNLFGPEIRVWLVWSLVFKQVVYCLAPSPLFPVPQPIFPLSGSYFWIRSGWSVACSDLCLRLRGIYTKVDDVDVDLAGKVERNIPEENPWNLAVIVDNVGDNEGDVAWMRSDLLRSYAESSCAALFGCVNIILLAPLFASRSCHFPVLIAMSRKWMRVMVKAFHLHTGLNSSQPLEPEVVI